MWMEEQWANNQDTSEGEQGGGGNQAFRIKYQVILIKTG